ncbi:MAG: SagB/ThcOx family dehydrogenase [Flavipsychrobacter sp.]
MHNIKNEEYFSLSELYHEKSKMRMVDYNFYKWINHVNSSKEIREVISKPNYTYHGYPSVSLKQNILTDKDKQEDYDMFLKRQSRREFADKPLSFASLSNILFAGDGVNRKEKHADGVEWNMRTAPSPGGLYPIDIYCVIQNVATVEPGLYMYSPVENCLYLISKASRDELNEQLNASMRPMRKTVANSAVSIMLVSNMMRAKFKYKERAYRFALLEAGHIAQNISLAVEMEDAGAVCVGGFMDDALNEMLDVDGLETMVQYCILIGTANTPDNN